MAWVLKIDDATIESGLVHDFDASLSGIGQELGAGAYSMRLDHGLNMLTIAQYCVRNAEKTHCLEPLRSHPTPALPPLCWV